MGGGAAVTNGCNTRVRLAQFRDGLCDLNADYREALIEFPAVMEPIVAIHPLGGGPFAGDAGRIKPGRLVRPT